ncbi:MAG TPA: 2,3-bisphosphoglycerate-independent phosphoglycerate mutase [Candidatus Manganitrophaceae bacterium]|nr:2,3-bisphosphoglycerate-independent phosphoglycerate mutase [Candidatus Manganitrophaceae bacterium]
MNPPPRPVILIILDGWGINPRTEANAIALADPPFYRRLLERYPHTELQASGEAVGLPDDQMGNSEVWHLNIGAGRIVYQELTRINKAIADGAFFGNAVLQSALTAAAREKSALHLLGLLSDGGVHSHIDHLVALLEMARRTALPKVRIHPFLDGRDTPPQSALRYIEMLERALKEKRPGGADWEIATVTGRYYAMDRDKRWDRTEKAYRAMAEGRGTEENSPVDAVQKSYAAQVGDEFVRPIVIVKGGRPVGTIQDRDSVIFFNFRADRARQLTRALTEPGFSSFPRSVFPKLSSFVTLTSYDETFHLPVAFKPVRLDQILGEVISERGLRQLRIAETEKYAHVTYFFNGGRETPFEGEERILIPSPKEVATYDQKPQMSAFEVTEEAVRRIESGRFDLIVLNFANPDMVGHSGILKAAIQAVEVIDRCLEKIITAIQKVGGAAAITADHGNLEQMVDYTTGEPHTAHTTLPVPFILVTTEKEGIKLRPGIHADVAPTLLDLMGIPKPPQMERDSLIVR